MNIKAERLLRRLSQAELAKILGTTSASVCRWENGATPRKEMRDKIKEYFKKKAKYIYL